MHVLQLGIFAVEEKAWILILILILIFLCFHLLSNNSQIRPWKSYCAWSYKLISETHQFAPRWLSNCLLCSLVIGCCTLWGRKIKRSNFCCWSSWNHFCINSTFWENYFNSFNLLGCWNIMFWKIWYYFFSFSFFIVFL